MSAKITHPLVFRLQRALEARKISVPRFGNEVHIPKDRIYKWFQEGTSPKANDQQKILRWLDGMENYMEKKPVTEAGQDWQGKYYALLEETKESYRKAIETMNSQQEELTELRSTVDGVTKTVEGLKATVQAYREWTIDELVVLNPQRDVGIIREALNKKLVAEMIMAEQKDTQKD